MQHQGDAGGLERLAGQLRAAFRRRRRHLLAEHVRKGNAGLLEDSALSHHAAFATATARAFPGVACERRFAVERFEFGADPVLQARKKLNDVVDIAHGVRALSILPLLKSRISDGPFAGPQSPGTM